MNTEAGSAGFYELDGRVQIITIEQALQGAKPAIPFVDAARHSRKRCAKILTNRDHCFEKCHII
jgi:hypothetical protein